MVTRKVLKACPVVLRSGENGVELLLFRHPKAGIQLVKGTVEPNEPLPQAALRELWEESGIGEATIVRKLGVWEAGFEGQVWHFFLCKTAVSLPDQWTHFTTDGGGHIYAFFWQPLRQPPTDEWFPLFQNAWRFLQGVLLTTD